MAKNAHLQRLIALTVLAAVAGCAGYAAYHNLEGAEPAVVEPAGAPEVNATASEAAAEPASLSPQAGTVRPASSRNFGPAAENPDLQFLVQLQGEPARTLPQLHREDPRLAQDAFEELTRAHRELRNLQLVRMSYGGRATLAYSGADPRDAAAADALSQEIIDRLSSLDFVRYAEPDFGSWR